MSEIKQKYKVGGSGAVFVLIILFLLYILNFADRAIVAIVLQPMKEALQLTDAQAGAVQSIFLLGAGLLMIPGAIFVERWSRRKMLGIMALIWSLATFATGLGTKFWHIMSARFVVGIGEAGYNPGGTAWLSLAFSKKVRGRILGLFQSATQVGMALGLIIGGLIVTQTGDWRMPFYVFAVPGIILGIITFFLPDYATVREKGEAVFNKKFFSEVLGLFKIKTYSINIIARPFRHLDGCPVAQTPHHRNRHGHYDFTCPGRCTGTVLCRSGIRRPGRRSLRPEKRIPADDACGFYSHDNVLRYVQVLSRRQR